MPQSLFEAISANRASFTPAQHRVADFLIQNPIQAAFFNARELGAATGVSESSIIRFAYCLGYDGYPALQEAGKQYVNTRLAMDERYRTRRPVEDVVQSTISNATDRLGDLARQLSSADVERGGTFLAQARRCYVSGFRGSAGLALIASSTLTEVGRQCIQLSIDAGETIDLLMDADSRDVLLVFGYGRLAQRTLQTARFAHERGMRVIAITNSHFSPLHEYADVLLVGDVEAAHPAYSLVSLVCILDCLILAYTKQLGDAAVPAIQAWEKTFGFFDYLGPADGR